MVDRFSFNVKSKVKICQSMLPLYYYPLLPFIIYLLLLFSIHVKVKFDFFSRCYPVLCFRIIPPGRFREWE